MCELNSHKNLYSTAHSHSFLLYAQCMKCLIVERRYYSLSQKEIHLSAVTWSGLTNPTSVKYWQTSGFSISTNNESSHARNIERMKIGKRIKRGNDWWSRWYVYMKLLFFTHFSHSTGFKPTHIFLHTIILCVGASV